MFHEALNTMFLHNFWLTVTHLAKFFFFFFFFASQIYNEFGRCSSIGIKRVDCLCFMNNMLCRKQEKDIFWEMEKR